MEFTEVMFVNSMSIEHAHRKSINICIKQLILVGCTSYHANVEKTPTDCY